MMKKFLLCTAAVLIGMALYSNYSKAQQADPRIETYKFLLNEANSRLADAQAANATLQTENAQLKVDLAKAKDRKD